MMEITREWARGSLMGYANKHESICEKLREIYDIVHDLQDSQARARITEKLIDALIMGKKMQDRLIYYKESYLDTSGSDGKNLREIKDSEELQARRIVRMLGGG